MYEEVFDKLAADRAHLPRVVVAVEKAVSRSFEKHHGILFVPQTVTQDEVKCRAKMCLDIVQVLRGDMGWGWDRICDHLSPYLDKKLDGGDWEPSARAAWAPDKLEPVST